MFSRIPWGARIFALIWLAVALLPPLHECFTAYYSEFYQYNTRSFSYQIPPPTSPNDLSAVSARFASLYYTNRGGSLFKEWDAFAAQHPREVWIRADRLRSTAQIGFTLSRPPRWFRPELLDQSIQCARTAEAIEPDNGFWPTMEAIFLFNAGRTEDARAALRRVAKSKCWNDYGRHEQARRIALYERVRPLLYEEKLPLLFYQSLDYLPPIRKVSQDLTKQGLRLEARGDKKGAFAIFSDVLGLGRFIHQHSDSSDGAFNGWVMESYVYWEVAKREGVTARSSIGNAQQKRQRVLATFSEVARRAGRADLAQSAQTDWEAEQKERTRTLKDMAQNVTGVSSNGTRLATQGTYLLIYVARLAFAGALLWIFGRLWAPLNIVVPTRGEIARTANFSFWSTTGAFALAWFYGVGGNIFSAYMGLAQSSDSLLMPRELAPVFLPLAALLSWLLPVVWTTRNRQLPPSSRPKLHQMEKITFRGTSSARLFLSVLTVGFWLISLQSGTSIWKDTPFAPPVPQYALKFCVLALLCLEIVRWRNIETRPLLRPYLASAFAISTLVALALISTSTTTLWSLSVGKPPLFFWMLPLLVITGFALTFVADLSKETRPSRPIDFFIAAASRSAGALAVAWSLFFLLGAGIIWPIRSEMNRQLDRRLTIGERAWRAEQTR